MKIAAVQLNADFANIQANLIQSENYIKQASLAQAELVLLPEFFTSAIGFSEQMLDVAAQNEQVHTMLIRWAAKYKIAIGGSYIHFDGHNAFNLFELVFPSGETFGHKKDIPTQFENCYYTHGDTDNVLITPIGNIGVALCWEMIRYDTLKRLAGKVDIILCGSCWWDLPEDASTERASLRQYNQRLALEAPVTLAKLLNVPVVHANHCGKVSALNFPNADRMQTRQLVGGAQIIAGDGQVVKRKAFSDGDGFILSDVIWDTHNRSTANKLQKDFWIPDLPEPYIKAWETVNPKGQHYYSSISLPYYKKHFHCSL